jgi:outer membrane protein assembly factor BamB
MTRVLTVGVALLAASLVRAGDWPQFRGPGGTGVSDEPGLPGRWGPSENVRWRADLPGRGVSGPVVAGGRAYVTASSGYRQDRLHVLCFNVHDGKKLWERQFRATGSTISNPKTCMAGPTPVCDAARVYALFATGDLACLDRDGNLLWYRALVQDYPLITNQVGMAASPVLVGDTLIVPMENAGDSFIAGLDVTTGRNRWKQPRPRGINWCTPAVITANERTEVVEQSPNELTAYDPETGARRWSFGPGLIEIPSPVPAPDGVLAPGGELRRLRVPADGGAPQVVWKNNRLRSAYASPLFYRDRVYAVTSANILSCADVATGKTLWQERVGLDNPVSASPVAGDGKVYVVSEAGTTAVVRAGDRPKVLATNALDEEMLATPALADGAIFLRSDRHLYCIGGSGTTK